MPDLIVERAHGVVTATLNRPARKNALTYDLFDALGALFAEVDENPDDRALVLRGAEGNFSTGMDLSDSSRSGRDAAAMRASMDRLNATALALHELRTPSIAAVDGLAVGAGMSLALGCDLVLATTEARFSAIFVRRGLAIDFGLSWLLPRLVGLAVAKELCLTGAFVSGDDALRLGLATKVVTPADLDACVNEVASGLAGGPSIAIGQDLALLDAALGRTFQEALDAEADAQVTCLASADSAEAIAAFLAKRDARFVGR